MAIDSKQESYRKAAQLWRQTRAAVAGKDEVLRLALDGLLSSPLYKTTQNNYLEVTKRQYQYWNRAKYFNATGRTVTSLDGMIWSKNPVKEWVPAMDYIEESVGAGSIREVAQTLTSEMIKTGRYGILVDMQDITGFTLAEMRNPNMIGYEAEQIIFYRQSGDQLLEVRLLEEYEVQTSELEFETAEQVRRLVLLDGVYHNQIWRNNEIVSDIEPIANGQRFSFIPFQFFGADDNSADIGEIPVFDLASQNLGHFTLDADNRDNLHHHGQGMTVVYTDMDGVQFREENPNGLDVGAKGLNQLGQGDKVEILQLAATGAIATEMERDEKRMIALGAQLVQDTNTNVTLGAKEMEFGASTSTLKRISYNATSGLNRCLEWLQMFKGISSPISYTLNTEFVTDDMTPEMVNAHMVAVQSGQLPPSTFYETARKAGLTKLSDEELIEAKEQEAFEVGGTTEDNAALMARIEALEAALNGNS